ncbi:stress response translation initiation inhibitor YciH [Candidatus Micrarchaeota archaeon]|nr:stress response translation initiation inhibitor YciH [Candidatus Micrarchaeota archaeon]
MIGGLPKELGVFENIEKSTKTSITVYTTQKRFKKLVTVIQGLEGKELDDTAKKLKHKLACGGSAKDGLVVLQGDHKEKVVDYLVELGYPREAIKVTTK